MSVSMIALSSRRMLMAAGILICSTSRTGSRVYNIGECESRLPGCYFTLVLLPAAGTLSTTFKKTVLAGTVPNIVDPIYYIWPYCYSQAFDPAIASEVLFLVSFVCLFAKLRENGYVIKLPETIRNGYGILPLNFGLKATSLSQKTPQRTDNATQRMSIKYHDAETSVLSK